MKAVIRTCKVKKKPARVYITGFRGCACKTVAVLFSNGTEVLLPRHQAIALGMDPRAR